MINISITAPNNIAIGDISLFMIYIDGENVRNVTSLSSSYDVSSCASHNVNVSAVDRCGREGPSGTVGVSPESCEDSACTGDNASSGNCKY